MPHQNDSDTSAGQGPTAAIGHRMHALIARLYPICRSITGNGVRQTLGMIGELVPLEIHEVPTGTKVFDWVVPKEWNVRQAYLRDPTGNTVVDLKDHSLHIVSYSTPIKQTISLAELKPHLHSLPDHPEWIPYRTSYYSENWGFCLPHRQLESLPIGDYEVVIDSSLTAGSLTYGELLIPGETDEEILLFTHICHPSLCNDNLSGIAVLTELAKHFAQHRCRHSLRLVFAPGTIGSITWLSRNEDRLPAIKHGLIIALVGDPGALTYKRSRRHVADVDRVTAHVLGHSGATHRIVDFEPYGYDERQFCSPGINLPVGRLTRSPNGAYAEYHSSADDLDLVQPEKLEESFRICREIIETADANRYYVNTSPKCEPQLGKRGLYSKVGGGQEVGRREYALLWVLNQSDGEHSLLDIAERSGLPFGVIRAAANDLVDAGLLVASDP